MVARGLFALACAVTLLGCAPEPVALTDAPWRAEVELPGGTLPFVLRFERDATAGLTATIENGAERLRVGRVEATADALTLSFPAFNSRMALQRDGRNYVGALTLTKEFGEEEVMPMTLTPNQSHRFFASEQDVNADYGGRWATTFTEDDGTVVEAVGEFTQRNGRVTGTFRTPTGDYRFLAGGVRDRTLYLSTFDGGHAFLFVATQEPNGRVVGDFWSGTQWHESFVAVRNANAALPDADAVSRIRDDVETLSFRFPDTRGNIVSLGDARFQGKVVVIALAGSWCPNCHDEAAFLAPYYESMRGRGLEVVGLMFEHLDDFDAAARQVDLFREKFGIEYPLLVAGISDKTVATDTLGLLDKVVAYPTLIVLDRTASVRRVHTGFNGPGTGVHYDDFRASFDALITELLEEDVS